MSRKTFYTERDIERIAEQGQTSLPLNDDTVYTELALESARELGITFIKNAPPTPPASVAAPLAAQIKAAVIAKLGNSVPEAIIDAAMTRILAQKP